MNESYSQERKINNPTRSEASLLMLETLHSVKLSYAEFEKSMINIDHLITQYLHTGDPQEAKLLKTALVSINNTYLHFILSDYGANGRKEELRKLFGNEMDLNDNKEVVHYLPHQQNMVDGQIIPIKKIVENLLKIDEVLLFTAQKFRNKINSIINQSFIYVLGKEQDQDLA